jgi:hypothetical protein
VPVDRASDAQRLDRELWPDRQQVGTGPIERRLRELGGVKALVVGAFAEHSADVQHTLVDGLGLAEAAIPRTRSEMQLLKNRNVLIATTKPLRRRPFFFFSRCALSHWPLATGCSLSYCLLCRFSQSQRGALFLSCLLFLKAIAYMQGIASRPCLTFCLVRESM